MKVHFPKEVEEILKVKNKIEIENCIKKHSTLKNRLRIVTIDDIAHRELIALDEEDFKPFSEINS